MPPPSTAMPPTTPAQRFDAFDSLTAADVQAVLAAASSLGVGAGVGAGTVASAAWRHGHVAVLCEPAASAPADALAAAAAALGAAVVRLRPSALKLHDRNHLRATLPLLGRLYGLICTEGLGPIVNAGVARWAGVPVLSDVCAAAHPSAILAHLLVMQEHAGLAAAALQLRLGDDMDARTRRAWRQVALLTGLQIARPGARPATRLAPTRVPRAAPAGQFVFGAGAQPGAGLSLALLALRAEPPDAPAAGAAHRAADALVPATDSVCLAARHADAHHRVLRSLMVLLIG